MDSFYLLMHDILRSNDRFVIISHSPTVTWSVVIAPKCNNIPLTDFLVQLRLIDQMQIEERS